MFAVDDACAALAGPSASAVKNRCKFDDYLLHVLGLRFLLESHYNVAFLVEDLDYADFLYVCDGLLVAFCFENTVFEIELLVKFWRY